MMKNINKRFKDIEEKLKFQQERLEDVLEVMALERADRQRQLQPPITQQDAPVEPYAILVSNKEDVHYFIHKGE